MNTKNIATFFAILAAALYAINIPLSKLLLEFVPPTMMAAFLYLGAGIGLFQYGKVTKEQGEKLTKAELPYTIGMIVLDIAAPSSVPGCAVRRPPAPRATRRAVLYWSGNHDRSYRADDKRHHLPAAYSRA